MPVVGVEAWTRSARAGVVKTPGQEHGRGGTVVVVLIGQARTHGDVVVRRRVEIAGDVLGRLFAELATVMSGEFGALVIEPAGQPETKFVLHDRTFFRRLHVELVIGRGVRVDLRDVIALARRLGDVVDRAGEGLAAE